MPNNNISFLRKIILPSLVLLIALALSTLLFYYPRGQEPAALSGAGDNLSGFAWSSNLGWISFNSSDCDEGNTGSLHRPPAACPSSGIAHDYGVKIDKETGNFSGYAWSSNMGWISFDRAQTGNPPGDPFNGGSGPIAHTELSGEYAGQISGWAKVLSMGEEGWIKLRSHDSDAGSIDYGVEFDPLNGELKGWAWNGNSGGITDTYGVGWISFNSSNQGAGDGVAYHVQSDLYMKVPVIESVEQAPDPDQCHQLVVDWDPYEGFGQSGFKVYMDSSYSDPIASPGPNTYLANISGLNPGVIYKFEVTAYNSTSETVYSLPKTGTTASVCQPAAPLLDQEVSTHGICPDQVQVVWEKAGVENADKFNIYRYKTDTETCPDRNDPGYLLIASGGCANVGSSACVGTNCQCTDDETKERQDLYCYLVQGIDTTEEPDYEGPKSEPVGPVQPCPPLPTWREVKVKKNNPNN